MRDDDFRHLTEWARRSYPALAHVVIERVYGHIIRNKIDLDAFPDYTWPDWLKIAERGYD